MSVSRPNIIFIMADDHAAKAIGCYGYGINKTPNLDRIANEGMRFNHCYVTNSICTPSRAAILTGMYNHVNGVVTLDCKFNNHLPNVAKHLRASGYQTAMVGKWHLGEGKGHEPSGFDYWSVLPGQGDYHDPTFIEMDGTETMERGYATDIITDKSINFIRNRKKDQPFFLMCHHKAPHRSWECHPRHKGLYTEEIKVPDTFDDDYKNRAKAAGLAKNKVDTDISYFDLGLVQPDGGSEIGELMHEWGGSNIDRKIPNFSDEEVRHIRLVCKDTAEVFTFQDNQELRRFKYQRYMQRYLRTIQGIDDSVGRLLDLCDEEELQNTMVIYTSDQGFFLGDHGWFDKRFMYEESFQMPFLIKHPGLIKPGSICDDIICNVDFAATWLELAGIPKPSYVQGTSFKPLLTGNTPKNWSQVAYHRYWMHRDNHHNIYAHYGVRDQRYKLIYWYAEDFGLPGTNSGGQEKEWELFDCEEDPLELFNVASDPKYAEIKKDLTRLLDEKMADIGDVPVHSIGY